MDMIGLSNIVRILKEHRSSAGSLNETPTLDPTAETRATSRPASILHSMDIGLAEAGANVTTATGHVNTPPRLPAFSTLDVPMVGSIMTNHAATMNNHAQQHLHHHNASIGRIPAGAIPSRHGHELSTDANTMVQGTGGAFGSIGSAIPSANNAGFGSSILPNQANTALPATPMGSYSQSYNANANHMAIMMNNLGLAPSAPAHHGGSYGYPSPAFATAVGGAGSGGQPRDSQQRIIQSRRLQDNTESGVFFFCYVSCQ